MSVGFGYESSSGRDTTGVGNAWGTRGGSLIRGIFNAVIPVTVVERIYGKLDGALFGLAGGTAGFNGFRPAVEFFSPRGDWELHSVNINYPIMGTVGPGGPNDYRVVCTLFTASGGFNPIEFNPTGEFGPQLVTNETFNQGHVRSQGGVAPLNNPLGFGWVLSDVVTRVGIKGSGNLDQVSDSFGRAYLDSGGTDQPIAVDKKMVNTIHFRRPLRILRGRRITFQLQALDATLFYTPVHSLEVSIIYNELPNPRGSFMT